MRLTRMNFIAQASITEPSDEIYYTRFDTSDGRSAVGRLVVFPRRDLLRAGGIDYERAALLS